MDRIRPMLSAVNIREVPPADIMGMGWPVTGPAPTATNILINACKTMVQVRPADNNPPKGFSLYLMADAPRHINHINKSGMARPKISPYSSKIIS
jgi:hypothetical protein